MAVEMRAGMMRAPEAIPTHIILAGVRGAGNPFDAARRNDVRAMRKHRRRLFRVRPIAVEKQPDGRHANREMSDEGMQPIAAPRRVCDDRFRAVEAEFVKRILPAGYIASIAAAQIENVFQELDEIADAATRLGKFPNILGAQEWNERLKRMKRSRVILPPVEIRTFTHGQPPLSELCLDARIER